MIPSHISLALVVASLLMHALPPTSALPDMVIDDRVGLILPRITIETFPVDGCSKCATPGVHKLLRFGTSFGNIGKDGIYVGDPPSEPNVVGEVSNVGTPFVWHECHGHYHNGMSLVSSELVSLDGLTVYKSSKIGFW